METIQQIAKSMQEVLTEEAERLGRETGFIKRQRKLSGASFAQALVFGWLGNPHSSMEELSQSAANVGVRISRQGLDERFGPEAAHFLQRLVECTIRQVIKGEVGLPEPVAAFAGVYILDSTVIKLPAELEAEWRGCGGSSVKISVGWELGSGALEVHVHAGHEHDQRAPFQHQVLPAKTLRLADLGYFNIGVLAELDSSEVYWVSRYKVGTNLCNSAGQPLDLLACLQASSALCLEMPVQLGSQQLPCRLIAYPIDDLVCQQRHRDLADWERRHQSSATATRYALCAWDIYLTNASSDLLPAAQVRSVATLRWQLEKLFDLWKTVGGLDDWATANPWRILCEVYAKLIALVIQHWLLLTGQAHHLHRSAFHAARTIRRKAWHLAAVLPDLIALTQTLVALRDCLLAGCRIDHSASSPPTFQRFSP